MSLQTPQLQFTGQASSPRSTDLGLLGPSPLHDISQWETSPLSPTPLRGQGPCGNGPGLSLSPWCTSSRKHRHHPLPTPILPKSSQEHFLRASLIFLGVPGWRGETQHPESTALRGNFCTPFIQSFSISPRPPEATVPGPLHLPAPAPPGLAAQLPQPKP